jgi:simple sugar transport system permease protein
VKAVPILLVGAGICIAFRANMLNIGGEGQLVMGGLAGTATALAVPGLPGPVLIPLVLLAGCIGGALWGAIPGALKAYLNVNEILSTIMMNIVAVQLMNFLLAHPLIDHTQSSTFARIPQTRRLSPNADLPILIHGTSLHLGVVVAILAAVAAYVLLWRTGLGFRLRAVGLSREAASYAGMPVKRTMTLAMALSGAMCGLGGAILVFGSASHRMVTDGTATGFTGSAGFNGIVAALFGGLHPLWTILSAFVFGGLLVGGNAVQIAVQVPTALIVALNGLVVVFVVSIEYVRRRSRERLDAAGPLTDLLAGAPVRARPRAEQPRRSEPSHASARPIADPLPPASEVEVE